MGSNNSRSSDAREASIAREHSQQNYQQEEQQQQQQQPKQDGGWKDSNPTAKKPEQQQEDESLLVTGTRSLDIGPSESLADSLAVPQIATADDDHNEYNDHNNNSNKPKQPPSPPSPIKAPTDTNPDASPEEEQSSAPWPHSVRYLVMLCAFLTSLSFGVTQVPLLYVFRLMTCDVYYDEHPDEAGMPGDVMMGLGTGVGGVGGNGGRRGLQSMLLRALSGLLLGGQPGMETGPLTSTMAAGPYRALSDGGSSGDRCSVHAIESSTALAVGLLGASTTVFGIANLFIAGALIKRIGVKSTLLINISFPALRLLVQALGVEAWGNLGMIVIQVSQVITVLGGPSGYLLVLNTFVTEVVEYEGRTAALGRLAGAMMFGSASGFLVGGVVSDVFGVKAPFRLAFVLFVASTAYVAVFLPKVGAVEGKGGGGDGGGGKKKVSKKKSAFRRFVEPLVVFAPKKFVTKDGLVQTEYGCLLLACGVFLSILATGYLQTLFQLFSTDVFGFGTTQNGWLIFMYSMLRGVFLTFIFPKLISVGRKVMKRREALISSYEDGNSREPSEREPLLSNQKTSTALKSPAIDATDKSTSKGKDETFKFDLIYTRFSIGADGILTLLCSFVQEGWQMFLVAAIVPFSAGTGSAAKGTVLQMIGSSASLSQRADALAGISLVENIARLSTTFVFGVIFAAFADIGRTELVFTVNAAVALLGLVVLLFARFPPDGSTPLEDDDRETGESCSRVS